MLNYKKTYKNILNTHLYMKGKMVICKKKSQFVWSLYGAQLQEKIQNILNTHLYMKGKMVKCKTWVKRKSKRAKIKMQEAFSQAAKFASC